jgi:hypothetical protein
MSLGNLVKERMELFNMDMNLLSNESFVDIETLQHILSDDLEGEVDEFDINMIASSLYCTPEYFKDAGVRARDIVTNSLNRGLDNSKSILSKAKIQNFVRDFVFIQEIIERR